MNYRMLLRQKEQLEFTPKVSKMTKLGSTHVPKTSFPSSREIRKHLVTWRSSTMYVSLWKHLIVRGNSEECEWSDFGKRSSLIFTYRRLNDNGEYRILNVLRWEPIAISPEWQAALSVPLRDKTEEEQKLEELVELHKKAEEANRLKTAFLAIWVMKSVRLWMPLWAFHIVAQGLQPENNEEFCQIIESNNKLLLQLISDIIDLRRSRPIRWSLSKEFDICKMIRETFMPIIRQTCPKTSRWSAIFPIRVWLLKVTKAFVQALTNILDNAVVKHTNKGYITIGYFSESKDIRFFVRDTGEGIRSPICHMYSIVSPSSMLCARHRTRIVVVSEHRQKFGGEIGVKSKLGKGSEFWFTLPANDSICEAS